MGLGRNRIGSGGRLAPAPVIGADAHRVASIDREYARRGRRVALCIVLAVLALLALAIVSTPWILSTAWARGRILARVNDSLADKGVAVDADSWRFRWTTPQSIHGLRVQSVGGGSSDPSWRVSAPSVNIDSPLWRLLPFGRLDAGVVSVNDPEIEITAPVSSSTAVAPMPVPVAVQETVAKPAAAPKTTEAVPSKPAANAEPVADKSDDGGFFLPVTDLSATLKVVNGSLRYRDMDSLGEVAVTGIAAEAKLESLSRPANATLSCVTPSSQGGAAGTFNAAIAIDDPMAFAMDGERAGSFRFALHGMDLAGIAPVLPRKNGAPLFLGGIVEASCESTFDLPDRTDATLTCAVTDLRLATESNAPATSAQFSGALHRAGRTLSIENGVLTSPWAAAAMAGSVDLDDGLHIATGNLRADMNIDLARVTRDFGAMLGMREGVEVRQGLLNSSLALESSADSVLLKAKATVSGPLSVVAEGQAYVLAAPSLDVALRKRGDAPFAIDMFNLVTSFGRIAGAGDSNGARVMGNVDLALFRRDCGRFFHNMPEMSGVVGIDGAFDFSMNSHVSAKVTLTPEKFSLGSAKDSLFTAGQGTLRATAVIPRQTDKPKYVANADIALRDIAYSSRGLKAPFTDKSLHFACGCEWTPSASLLKLGKVAGKCAWADFEGGEAVYDYADGKADFAASGNLALDWGRMSRWLAETGTDWFSVEGRGMRPFRVEGSFADGADAFIARARGEAKTHISKLSTYGIVTEPADASIALADGVAKVAFKAAANGGKADLSCDFVLSESPRRVRSQSRVFVLENARVNDTMLQELLGYVNPVLTQCKVKGGTISASLMPFDLPLDKDLIKKSSFQGRLSLDNLELAPSGDLAEILKIARLSDYSLKLKHQAVDIVCKDGRIATDAQRFDIWKFPIVFRGFATLDGDIDYKIDIPVQQAVLEAVGPEFADMVKDRALTIPVSGSVKHPRIDERSLRGGVADLVKDVANDEIRDNGRDLLEGILKNIQDKAKKKFK